MFRRFLVVCWVLVTISAITAAACYGLSAYYESRILSIRVPGMTNDGASVSEIRHDLHIAYHLMVMEAHDRAQNVGDEWRQFLPDDLMVSELVAANTDEVIEFPSDMTAEDFGKGFWERKADYDNAREWYARSDRFEWLSVYAGLVALVILLWNIILHTGHWIWMGRKAER